ncbi:MAG TPA: XdhC family protein [Pyrinomonadaceae bacterium]|nr:XdhC family protein [Pyrinomonadaceae bacterium]
MSGAGANIPSGELARAIARSLAGGAVAALATALEAPGRPEAVGAKILVEEDGTRAGTTGSAALDAAVGEFAPAFLASRAEARTFRVEELAAPRVAGSVRPEEPAEAGRQLPPGLEEWRGARLLFERIEPEPHVVVCGAGHVGASLARLAAAVGYRVTLIDDRRDFVVRERFPGEPIALVAAEGGWAEAVNRVVGRGRGVSVAVVTRGHNEDEECMSAVLAARPDYVGMIGSKRRTNIVLARLREAGFPDETLREVRAPIGLDIGAVSPEEVALAVLAEIIAHRRGGTGRPLSAWRRE